MFITDSVNCPAWIYKYPDGFWHTTFFQTRFHLTQTTTDSPTMPLRNLAKVSSSLQAIINFCKFSAVGGEDSRFDMANLIIVAPSVRLIPYWDSRISNFSLDTLCTRSSVSSEIRKPIVFVYSRLESSLNKILSIG